MFLARVTCTWLGLIGSPSRWLKAWLISSSLICNNSRSVHVRLMLVRIRETGFGKCAQWTLKGLSCFRILFPVSLIP